MRNNIDAAEYKLVALELIFLKNKYGAAETKRTYLGAQVAEGMTRKALTSIAPWAFSGYRRSSGGPF